MNIISLSHTGSAIKTIEDHLNNRTFSMLEEVHLNQIVDWAKEKDASRPGTSKLLTAVRVLGNDIALKVEQEGQVYYIYSPLNEQVIRVFSQENGKSIPLEDHRGFGECHITITNKTPTENTYKEVTVVENKDGIEVLLGNKLGDLTGTDSQALMTIELPSHMPPNEVKKYVANSIDDQLQEIVSATSTLSEFTVVQQ